MKPLAARLHTWTWALIYVGMVVAGLGWSVRRHDDALGWTLLVLGGGGVAVGIVLIWVRSRLTDPLETR